MEFTNASLDKVNDALKVVKEFTDEVLVRAEKWVELNWRDDQTLPAPHIVFHQEGWKAWVEDADKVLNDTTNAPIRVLFMHPEYQWNVRGIDVPYSAIFTEA